MRVPPSLAAERCNVRTRAARGRPFRNPQPLAYDPLVQTELERSLAALSAAELVDALGLAGAPSAARALARVAFTAFSVPLGRALARFDRRIEEDGVAAAAAGMLDDLGARWSRIGEAPPADGPLLVVANHPGAYDALVLLAALERRDVAIVAADRAFLHAMPALRRHLVFVPEPPSGAALGRAIGVRRALAHLAGGGALLHFGAGRIEPDPAFLGVGADPLEPWQSGTGALVRGAAASTGAVVPAVVEGVHSPRAKRLLVTRLAERRGLTTLAPLLQVVIPRYRDVEALVRFGDPVPARQLAGAGTDAQVAAAVRASALALWPLLAPVRPASLRHGENAAKRVYRAGPSR
jgi:hypothetical protein